MEERMRARLAELTEEYRRGETQLRELMQQESGLREVLLRISGAIQVLEEVMRGDAGKGHVPTGAAQGGRDAPADEGATDDRPRVLVVP